MAKLAEKVDTTAKLAICENESRIKQKQRTTKSSSQIIAVYIE